MKACIVSLSLLFGTVFGAVGDNCWPKVIFPGDYPDPSIMRDGRDSDVPHSVDGGFMCYSGV